MDNANIDLDSRVELTKQEKHFIIQSLIKGKIIKSLDDIRNNDLRIVVEEENSMSFYVYIGSSDPYKGGSGNTYAVSRADGEVTLEMHEDLAPVPED